MTLDPSTLPGGTDPGAALWLFAEGSGRLAKNALAATVNSGTNLCYAPEQLFSTLWANVGLTVTEAFAANPNGVSTATRLVGTAGDRYSQLANMAAPAGQYTLSVYVKSNTGADQNLRLGIQDSSGGLVISSAIPVTDAGGWQRISFTRTAAGTVTNIYVMNDGSSAVNVLVWGVQLEQAATPSAYRLATLDFMLPGTGGPTWIAAGLRDTSGDKVIGAVSNTPATYTAVTLYAVVKQSSNSAYQFVLSDVAGYQKLGAPCAANVGTVGQSSFMASGYAGCACDLNTSSWHILETVWDGTTLSHYVDGALVASAAASTSWLSKGILRGYDVLGFKGDEAALAIYPAAHSASERLQMRGYLRETLAIRSISIPDLTEWVMFEGDSITGASEYLYPYTAMQALSPKRQWANKALSGSTLTHLNSRAAAVDATLSPRKTHPVLFVLVGANDATSPTFLADLEAYCRARMAAGWIVVVCTILPRTAGGFNTVRNAHNIVIRQAVANGWARVVCDMGGDSIIGTDAAASDTGLFSDGTHLTTTGQNRAAVVAQPPIEAALLISTGTGGGVWSRSTLNPFNLSPFIL